MKHLHDHLRAWAARARAAWRYACARRDFEQLDESSLRDLGLSASDLPSYWAEWQGDAERTRLRTAASR
jgi:uncharacterized protein YjiS (DUF1127 family)